jgi:hypothetical protein
MDQVILKINFEEPYDKVEWPFLQQPLHMNNSNANGLSSSRKEVVSL